MTTHAKAPADTVESRNKVKLERDLGPEILTALHDPKTVEIMLNADGKVWRERLGGHKEVIVTIPASRGDAIIKTIAGLHQKEATRNTPLIECELPLDGSRFAGQLPPVVSAPTFAIRKKALAIFSLDQYVEADILTQQQLDTIRKAVRDHRNILVIGGTGSGKTTLVNAIINAMVVHDPSERLIIIEDTGEIQCAAADFVQYHTTVDISMTTLLKTTLRMRPDRIIVGEVRGPEALDLIMAWNTGHEGGAATIHANSALGGLSRMSTMISMHPYAPSQIESLIAESVHILIFINKTPDGRRIREIVEVTGYENGKYLTNTL